MNAQRKETHPTKAQSFDRIVREVFAPIYPTIAEQIIAKTGLFHGICLDAGCGTGALGRALGKLTQMEMIFFDKSHEMIELAKQYAHEEALACRSSFIVGDIHAMACCDGTIDLVISRGSSPFWEDWHKAYEEILRVLKIGGHAYIGGGFGTAQLRDEIVATMHARNPEWRKSFQDRLKPEREALPSIMQRLNPSAFEIIDDESGFWIHIIK